MEGSRGHPASGKLWDGLPWTQNVSTSIWISGERQFDMDVCSQLPHAALRLRDGAAVSTEKRRRRQTCTRWPIGPRSHAGGCIGHYHVAPSSPFQRRQIDPSFEAAEAELLALAGVLAETNRGVIQLITDFEPIGETFGLLDTSR